jgi:5'-nucleotidase
MILLTNDDGYRSPGLEVLYRAASSVFGKEVVAVAPEGPQSASGMSFTFHKPLRIDHINHWRFPCFSVSGTPADCVLVSLFHIFKNKKIDLVLSGVNIGVNAGLDTIYSSGTISAALYSAIFRVKSMAFSKMLPDNHSEEKVKSDMKALYNPMCYILKRVKEHGIGKGIDMLNVNFPLKVNSKTEIMPVKASRNVFNEAVTTRKDPHGRSYYWLSGSIKQVEERESDMYQLQHGKITITPVKLSVGEDELIYDVKRMLD